MDIDRKKVQKNAYRITKNRKQTCLRIRVPGGHLETKYLHVIQNIAERYGNGTLHLTTRQGFEIPGIRYEDMEEINTLLKDLIESLNLKIDATLEGYPAAGTRNIAACIGNRVCPFANDDTTRLAKTIEREIFPHDLHFKIAVTGCPNDCIKAHMNDFGILCITEPQYHPERCISCNACALNCEKRVTGALQMKNFNIERDSHRCIGCGECILKCPTSAWTRSDTKYYRMLIMGRTGKKNPRLAEPFIKWCTEDVVIQVIKNTYDYVNEHIDLSLPKEHIGYIVDRTGYHAFKEAVLKGVTLNSEAQVADSIQWSGYVYRNF